MPKVFVSYSIEDSEAVRRVIRFLKENEINVFDWQDLQNRGSEFIEKIQKEISDADHFIACLSDHFLKSRWCGEELQLALALENHSTAPRHSFIKVLKAGNFSTANFPSAAFLQTRDRLDPTKTADMAALLNLVSSVIPGAGRPIIPGTFAPPVNFVNRRDEIDSITATTLSEPGQYYIIHSPAQYGKTELLKELDRRFGQRENWDHALARVESNNTLQDIAEKLSDALGLQMSTSADNDDWGYRFGGALANKYNSKNIPPAGLALLIDLDKELSSALIETLLESFIPHVWESLTGLDSFLHQQSLFRVIVCGRYLATSDAVQRTQLPHMTVPLNPFTYDVIRTSSKSYLGKYTNPLIDNLAADILFLTGGHPGAMAFCLQYTRRNSVLPNKLLSHQDTVWNRYLKEACEHAHRWFDQTLFKPLLDPICVFRYTDEFILGKILGRKRIPHIRDEYDLMALLPQTHLFENKGRYIRDDIVRRLLIIRLRKDQTAQYQRYCQNAQTLCEEHLLEDNVHSPEKWAVEYLYQYLQSVVDGGIIQADQLSAIKKQWKSEVKNAIKLHLKASKATTPQSKNRELGILRNEMNEPDQWEFRFLLNYVMRNSHYNDDPYNDLLAMIR